MQRIITLVFITLLGIPAVNADILFAVTQGTSEDIVVVDEVNGSIRNLSKHPARDIEPAVSSSGIVAFMSAREGSFDIITCDRNGNGLENITRTPAYEGSPVFSPDGEWIAILAGTREESELRVMKRDGSNVVSLAVADNILDVAWAPDSRRLALATTKGAYSYLLIVDCNTHESRSLVRTSVESHLQSEAFPRAVPIRVQITACEWSPDGKKIAYVRHPEVGTDQQLRVIDPEGVEDKLLLERRYAPQDPIWSRDSEHILYASATILSFVIDTRTGKQSFEGSVHVFITSLDGRTRQITKGSGLHRCPVYSPDEQSIAFLYEASVSSENTSVRTMKIDGTDTQTIHDSAFGRTTLCWF